MSIPTVALSCSIPFCLEHHIPIAMFVIGFIVGMTTMYFLMKKYILYHEVME